LTLLWLPAALKHPPHFNIHKASLPTSPKHIQDPAKLEPKIRKIRKNLNFKKKTLLNPKLHFIPKHVTVEHRETKTAAATGYQ
jgi:hypothetical protein